jgi:S1-C subfamily serine protease
MLDFPQDSSAAHPQVIEVPQPQPALPAALQSELAGEQGLGELGKQSEGINASQSELLARRPAYLGITYDTSPSCRYPAGVRVTGMFEGSPAQRAGLRADGKVQWQHAIAGLLALSPAALLAIPLIMSADKDSGPGDIVLAVDGERVRRREEFEQTMRRFEPGDVVYFSVLRRGSILQVPVKLEEYPSTSEPSVSLAEATTAKGKKVYMY